MRRVYIILWVISALGLFFSGYIISNRNRDIFDLKSYERKYDSAANVAIKARAMAEIYKIKSVEAEKLAKEYLNNANDEKKRRSKLEEDYENQLSNLRNRSNTTRDSILSAIYPRPGERNYSALMESSNDTGRSIENGSSGLYQCVPDVRERKSPELFTGKLAIIRILPVNQLSYGYSSSSITVPGPGNGRNSL